MLDSTGMEVVSIANVVQHHQVDEYVKFANDNHEQWLEEAHMLEKGNLDEFTPINYYDHITKLTAKGFFPQNLTADYYTPLWSFSPPPFTYSVINGDYRSLPWYNAGIEAVIELQNETVLTAVRPYSSVGLSITQEEHDAMHSSLSKGFSRSDYPHTFMVSPVHEQLQNTSSKIVAVQISGFAWDAAWRNLLPEGVNGITAVLSNSCNQSFTYRVSLRVLFLFCCGGCKVCGFCIL